MTGPLSPAVSLAPGATLSPAVSPALSLTVGAAASPTVSPARWLAEADALLTGGGGLGSRAVTAGWWPKACACLIRLALEAGIDGFWQRSQPAVAACRRGRTKQLMLRDRRGPGPQVAGRIAYAWAALSEATHHHCYELAPTAAELRRLHREVSDLLTHLDR